jgi:hypothetical protein
VIAARCLPTPPAPAAYGRDTPRPIADPADAIVVIFIHGAQPAELGPDPCEMDHVNAPFGVPNVVHRARRCFDRGAPRVGRRLLPPTRIGPIDPRTGQRTNRLDPRVRETGARAAAYAAMGVPPARIFLPATRSAAGARWSSSAGSRS